MNFLPFFVFPIHFNIVLTVYRPYNFLKVYLHNSQKMAKLKHKKYVLSVPDEMLNDSYFQELQK